MDYTTVDQVKAVIGANETTDDALLLKHITAASRAIDRYCTGANAGSDDFFEMGDVVDELPNAVVDKNNNIVCYPQKSLVNSVTALSYRFTPLENWKSVSLDRLVIERGTVVAWESVARQPIMVKISYNGGFAADVTDLPADLVEATTVLAVRYYKEGKTGLGDAIGVAELGQMVYTKALPVRVKQMLAPFVRVVPW